MLCCDELAFIFLAPDFSLSLCLTLFLKLRNAPLENCPLLRRTMICIHRAKQPYRIRCQFISLFMQARVHPLIIASRHEVNPGNLRVRQHFDFRTLNIRFQVVPMVSCVSPWRSVRLWLLRDELFQFSCCEMLILYLFLSLVLAKLFKKKVTLLFAFGLPCR